MLQKYIETIFGSWKVLQFAVQQQTGGPESNAISKWMNGVTEQFFYDNDDLDSDEVADFLCIILNQELNILVEDGSELEVSEILCHVYKLYKAGNTNAIEDILSKIPQNSHMECKVQTESDDEKMEMCQQVSSQISSLSLSEGSDQPLTLQAASEVLSPEEEQQRRMDELDGWTVIMKGKRKNR